ncbi:MAG TPA: hypothetical protein VKY85_00990 [Candidatus Angelobacter sp.]|nr:hypothetical protein [Candidatus Angelobacter sp.]
MILHERRKNGRLDMEATEMALRLAMHQVSAVALGQLLQCDPPGPDQRQQACSCGQTAPYQALRSRRILTVVGEVELGSRTREPDFLWRRSSIWLTACPALNACGHCLSSSMRGSVRDSVSAISSFISRVSRSFLLQPNKQPPTCAAT